MPPPEYAQGPIRTEQTPEGATHAVEQAASAPGRARSLLRRIGWQHRGYRVANVRRWLLVVIAIIAPPYVRDLSHALQVGLSADYVDLRIWHRVANAYLTDPQGPLYQQHPSYLYPPFFLTLIAPLFQLPDHYAAAVFQTLKWAAMVLSLWVAWRLCSPCGERLPPFVTLGSFLLTFRFLRNEIANANINMFILAAVLGSTWFLARRRPIIAGLILGMAACVKVTPALVLAYCVYKRWWRTLIGSALACVACLIAWPAIFLGWDNNWRQLVGWYDHLLGAYLSAGKVYSIYGNQSLPALLNRLLGPYVAVEPSIHMAFVVLPELALTMLRVSLSLALLGAVAYVCRRRLNPTRQPLALAAEVALVQIAMLTLSGYSWKAHFVAMLLPNTVVLAYLADARYPGTARRWATIWLLISFVLCTLTTDIITPRGADYAEIYGLVLFGALAAAAALVGVRRALRDAPAPSFAVRAAHGL